jgi:hypothetical protein
MKPRSSPNQIQITSGEGSDFLATYGAVLGGGERSGVARANPAQASPAFNIDITKNSIHFSAPIIPSHCPNYSIKLQISSELFRETSCNLEP